jgi:hypothetical protein
VWCRAMPCRAVRDLLQLHPELGYSFLETSPDAKVHQRISPSVPCWTSGFSRYCCWCCCS